MKIIEVEHLTFSYESSSGNALSDVSFAVEEGSYVALIGHNGSGKSTLAKVLSGLLGGYGGKVSLFGTELTAKTLYSLRSRMGLVFQNPDNQFVGSTVRDDIAFGLENRQVPHDQMESIILRFSQEVGMEKFLDSAPENLSGGQKQRVAIAGVLAMTPELIIYDEATSMLDPVGKKDILDITFRLRQENPKLTVLSITHDIEEAAKADSVLVLNEGKLVLSGAPKEVFAHQRELKDIRLDCPFYEALVAALKAKGIAVPDSVDTEEKLEEWLCR
jgi:energy-coupling factor transport system ATP-binding protein